jgi:hypothetical protein
VAPVLLTARFAAGAGMMILALAPAALAETADFLIIGSLSSYTVLDRFEQPLGMKEKGALGADIPLRIVARAETLGDGITRAMRVTIDGETYYFPVEENGDLQGGNPNVRGTMLQGCAVVGDTVEAMGGVALSREPGGGPRRMVTPGARLVRILRYQNAYYVKTPGESGGYGWAPVSAALKRVAARIEPADNGADERLRLRLIERVESANETYRVYVDHFNRLTGQQRSAPRWHCSLEGAAVRCRLGGHYKETDEFDESSRRLVQDLQSMALGKPVAISYTRGEIVIEPKLQP